ncbi:MAG: DUF5618 family protein [Nitrospirae bacterium]|jgi:uncharacterized protein (UPF0332 family)|nr:DUF5618 family protein [Nitrospirota bacterium]
MQKKEAIRYMENAKKILSNSPVEDNVYTDIKYVKSACGVAYLGVLKAIDEYLLSKGLTAKELPRKAEEYEKALQKYASVHDGKLLKQFDRIYNELHIAGYYRGLLKGADTVKDAIKAAKEFINKLRLQ